MLDELTGTNRHPGDSLGVREPEVECSLPGAVVASPRLYPRDRTCRLDLRNCAGQRIDSRLGVFDDPGPVALWDREPWVEREVEAVASLEACAVESGVKRLETRLESTMHRNPVRRH